MDNNNNALATTTMPDEVCTQILQHLTNDDKQAAYVSKQFLRAWRAGVVGLRFHVPAPLSNGSLLHRQPFGNYPNLKFIHSANDRDDIGLPYLVGSQDLIEKQLALKIKVSVSLSLYFKEDRELIEAYEFLKGNPELAKQVTSLSILTFEREDIFYKLLALLPNLMTLEANYIECLTDEGLKALGTSPHLAHLHLVSPPTPEGDATLAKLGQLSTLKTLNISNAWEVSGAWLESVVDGIPGLESLRLHIADENFSASNLKYLSGAKNLQTLTLVGPKSRVNGIVDADPLLPLSDCTSLVLLNLVDCPMTGSALAQFSEIFPHLETLNLYQKSALLGHQLSSLYGMKQLQRLCMVGEHLRIDQQDAEKLATALPMATDIRIPMGSDEARQWPIVMSNGSGNPVVITGHTDLGSFF